MNTPLPLSRRSFSRRLLDAILYVSLLSSVTVALTACPPGTKTVVQAGVSVKVDPEHCKEDRSPTSNPDLAVLNCTTVEGTANVQITFPRKEWHALRTQDAGLDTGPGK